MKLFLVARYILEEAFSRKMILLILGLIVFGLVGVSLALNLDVVEGSLASVRLFGKGLENTSARIDVVMFHIFQTLSIMIFNMGIFVGIITTSALAISFFAPGRIELLLSLPLRREEIVLGTFLGVVMITGLGFVLALGGLSGVLFVKANYFSAGPLAATLMGLLAFMCIYAWMLFMSVLTQSVPLSQMTGFLIFFLCSISGKSESIASVFDPGWKRTLVEWIFLPFPSFSELTSWSSNAAGGAIDWAAFPSRALLVAVFFMGAGLVSTLAVFSQKDY